MSLLSDIAIAIKTKLGGASINNTIPRYDGIACSLKSSGVTISDTDVVTAGGGFVGNLTGTASNATLAASATKLATARTINGVAFDGTANITVADSTKAPLTGIGASGTWDINITGNSTKLNNAVEDVNATANTIVKRDDNGFIKGVVFHTTASDTTSAASHYYVETGSDGYIRPKPLASVKAEIAGDRAPLASPALTGTPTAPTAAAGTNNTQIATTAFVLANGASVTSVKTALNASGTAPIYACRAWVNFNGTGTVAIRASGNVSSITDNGVGDYTVNFTTAIEDSKYCATVTSSSYSATSNSASPCIKGTAAGGATNKSPSSITILSYAGNTLYDFAELNILISR